MKKIITILFVAFTFLTVNAQLVVTNDTNTVQLVNGFILTGVTASNVTFTGTVNTLGTFINGNTTDIGLNNGIIMTTGNFLSSQIGSSASNFATYDNGGAGCGILDSLVSGTTYDATILEFDLIPAGNVLEFQYVFASEEYSEYVNSSFNDVFGFFIGGANPSGGNYTSYNIAIIPGTSLPVAINNVNNGYSSNCTTGPCTNCSYFIDNCTGLTIIFDGFTSVLQAQVFVIPYNTYHLKMAIADVGDGIYDSGIFLKAQSMKSYNGNVGITNIQNSDYSLFPNPADDKIEISLTVKSEIEILNMAGQSIKSINADEKQINIDISGFTKGIYLLKVKNENGIAVEKFIKE
ncbi:MAG: choice-of-anchor L domain-containing protein [Bacteroidota bacterium]